jgi:hypothetical protein
MNVAFLDLINTKLRLCLDLGLDCCFINIKYIIYHVKTERSNSRKNINIESTD